MVIHILYNMIICSDIIKESFRSWSRAFLDVPWIQQTLQNIQIYIIKSQLNLKKFSPENST